MINVGLMNILLVNPNSFDDPPVIPIGLEYIASSIESLSGIKLDILDLAFDANPQQTLASKIEQNKYDIAGITVRNIDEVIFKDESDCRFFLPEIKTLIQVLKEKNKNIKIIVGGSGCDADPQGVFDYLRPDILIFGPGEIVIRKAIKKLQSGESTDQLINGWKYGIDPNLQRSPMKYFDYKRYSLRGGIVSFQTQAGCNGKCHFCFEQSKTPMRRNPDVVIGDIIEIARSGYNYFHLTDSEFNQDLAVCKDFLEKLKKKMRFAGVTIKWTLCMKPTPVDQMLFEQLKETGVNLITLSVESYSVEQKKNSYSLNDIQIVLDYARDYGISIAIDMMTGAPDEEIIELERMIRFFQISKPKRVNINPVFRIYRNTPLYRYIKDNFEKFKDNIINLEEFGESTVIPVYFQKFSKDQIEELISSESNQPIFKLEGTDKGVNRG